MGNLIFKKQMFKYLSAIGVASVSANLQISESWIDAKMNQLDGLSAASSLYEVPSSCETDEWYGYTMCYDDDMTAVYENGLRSTAGDKSIHFTVWNHSDATVSFWWVAYEGQLHKYYDLAPGASYTQQTFATHPWVASIGDDTPIAVLINNENSMDQQTFFLKNGP